MRQELEKAIAAHSLWKTKLRNTIKGGEAPSLLTARSATACEFGKWLATLPKSGEASVHVERALKAHAAFHEAAAAVLLHLQAGRTAEAEATMSVNGAYSVASAHLTQVMLAWREAA